MSIPPKKEIQEKIFRMMDEHLLHIEERIKLHIQPKPKLLPTFIWKLLLKRLLFLEKFGMEIKNG